MQFVFSAPLQIDLGDFSDKNMETILLLQNVRSVWGVMSVHATICKCN